MYKFNFEKLFSVMDDNDLIYPTEYNLSTEEFFMVLQKKELNAEKCTLSINQRNYLAELINELMRCKLEDIPIKNNCTWDRVAVSILYDANNIIFNFDKCSICGTFRIKLKYYTCFPLPNPIKEIILCPECKTHDVFEHKGRICF